MIACIENDAQFLEYGSEFYHSSWMRDIQSIGDIEALQAEIIEITEEEYNYINDTIDKGEEVVIPNEDDTTPAESIPDEDENVTITVSYMKQLKINEMSRYCEDIITKGCDVLLSDGKLHHFSLSIQDQLNLISLSTMLATGMTEVPYHADNELCKNYSPEDITSIINTATAFKTYHITYFNSLKAYINSLKSIKTVSNVEYGMDIPDKYQSEVLVTLLSANN